MGSLKPPGLIRNLSHQNFPRHRRDTKQRMEKCVGTRSDSDDNIIRILLISWHYDFHYQEIIQDLINPLEHSSDRASESLPTLSQNHYLNMFPDGLYIFCLQSYFIRQVKNMFLKSSHSFFLTLVVYLISSRVISRTISNCFRLH
uniref:Uncharacterized protein n=1 Tax=Cacopsylla melanoneura TaxID=428564 RepID=A0A8D8ZD38_9HEMI